MASTNKPGKHKMFSKNQSRVSSTGRKITTPKNILTTSDDEEPPLKKAKPSALREKMEKLKILAAKLELKQAASCKTSSKGKESAADADCNKIRLKGKESAAGADCNKPRPKENKSAAGAGCSKARSEDNENASGPNCNEISSHKTKQLYASSFDSDETNPTKMTELSNKKNHKDLKTHSDSLSVPPSSVLETEESVEKFDSSFQNEPLIVTNSVNTMLTETFLNSPLINIPNSTCAGCEEILKRLQVIEAKMDNFQNTYEQVSNQNSEILQILRARFNNEQLSNKLYQKLQGYPIDTVEKFRDLEKQSNKQERQKVHDHLVQLGGLTLREFLKTALKEIMTDTLVLNYSWHKQTKTEKFGDTRISNVFYQAAVNCPLFAGPENKTVYKDSMLAVFKATKQRCRKKLPKNNANKGSNLEKQVEDAIANVSSILGSDYESSGSEGDVEDLEDDLASDSEEASASEVEDENFT